MAQRVFMESVQPPVTYVALTWQSAYQRIELSRAHLVDALREVRQLLRAGEHTHIEVLIDHHIGDDP